MRFSKVMTALAACSLVASPALATSPALLSADRAATEAGESNEAVGGFLIPLIAIVAVVGGVLIISDDDGDSN